MSLGWFFYFLRYLILQSRFAFRGSRSWEGTSSEKRSTGAFFSPLLRARHKNQLSACHWVGFFIFSATSSSNHASPSEARVLGKGRRRKNAPQEPFSLLYFGRATKTNLVLVTGLVFLFSPLPHPPITLRLPRLAFLGRDVVGKTLHRSLFLSSTSGAPQKPT